MLYTVAIVLFGFAFTAGSGSDTIILYFCFFSTPATLRLFSSCFSVFISFLYFATFLHKTILIPRYSLFSQLYFLA